MPINIKVRTKPTKYIKERLGLLEGGKFLKFCTDTCYKHMDQYVPYDTGMLRINAIMDINGGKITYIQPYARYQYYGVRADGTHEVKNYTTPGTGKYWDRLMVSADGKKVEKELQDFIDRGGN